jgi:pimeloyl-ACP methyl ester carboxylesterase
MSSAATKTVRSEDGTTIAYDRVGAGPAVTVVGGGPTDRLANAPLAALLADRFTVYSYDRRGRGESGAAEAYAVERECEDLGAVIAAAGGVAAAFGTSSGAVLTLEAASRGVSLSSLVLWEPSYVVDDSRTPPPAGLADSVAELVAAGRNGMHSSCSSPAPSTCPPRPWRSCARSASGKTWRRQRPRWCTT